MLRAARYHARRTAVIDGETRLTYAETASRIERAAAALRAVGLGPGAHVAVLAQNTHRFFEAYFACSRAGLVAVPLNNRLAMAEIAYILDDSESRAVLLDPDCADLMPPAGDRLVVPLGQGGWEDWVAADGSALLPPVVTGDDALAHLCYTGGTTGRPKGVMLSHRNVVSSALNKIVLGSFQRDDVWLHAAPMFHQADSWACFAFTQLGAAHVFLPKFRAEAALDLIERHRVTGTQIVPTMILMMLDAAGDGARDGGSLRRILYGSAPMPTEHLRRGEAVFGPVFQHIYGLTEAAGTVAATPWPAEAEETEGRRRASCGQPVTGVDLRIASADRRDLPPGEVGHILARGPNVMLGYWRRPDETLTVLRDGWLDTGDLGAMDADGFLFIVDRAKDMIISGGENVYSSEVEDVLCDHPDVLEAAVIGLPDEKWGEAVTAVVVLRDGADTAADAIVAHCRDRIAGYKCPKAVYVTDVLPKTPAGKIAKTDLRETYG